MKKYECKKLGETKVPIDCGQVTLQSGAVIEVGRVKKDDIFENVGEFQHRIYSNGANGEDTVLEFSLTREACIATVRLYEALKLDQETYTADKETP